MDVATPAGQTELYRTTELHPFWVEGVGEGGTGRFVAAGDLLPGMQLRLGDGSPAYVTGVEATGIIEPVYNFSVDGWHTYHVGELGVWVHNDRCFVSETTDAMNAEVLIDDGIATVNFTQRRATSLSRDSVQSLREELIAEGVQTIVVNSGQIVEPSGQLSRILSRAADNGHKLYGLDVYRTGNPSNKFILTGNF